MGWRGTLRSVVAASRAIDRENQRRKKEAHKAQMINDAADAVADWEDYIHNLTSLHTDLANHIDWVAMAERPKPLMPRTNPSNERAATAALNDFKPGLFDFLRGGSAKRREALEEAVMRAKERDATALREAGQEHASSLRDWESDAGLAKRVLTGEPEAIKEVISELQSHTDIGMIGTAISFSITDEYVHAMPEVHGFEIVPSFRRKQLASGKLSETKMPISQANELYQDFVASAALRIAGDVFQILPLEEVYVTCMAQMLNTATGHQENSPILSVQVVRQTFSNLRLNDIDPSDSLVNFNHVMRFKKTKGFEPIEPLLPMAND